MTIKTLENTFEVEKRKMILPVEREVITVSHLDGKVSFDTKSFKGIYDSVGNQIEEVGLEKPTPEKTASLVYSAYENPDNKYAKEIKNIMKNSWFWMFNTIKYVPNEGAFIQKPNQEDVFVPFGYKIRRQSSLELSKNKFVIGLFGEEGADKIARVADTYSNKPHLYSFENVDKEITRNSALSDSWVFGYGLSVYGYWGGGNLGHAFGVSPSETTKK